MRSPDARTAGEQPAAAVVADGLGVRLGSREVLREVDLSVLPGELVAVTGASGCGKSTLISAVIGLVAPSAGTLSLFGQPVQECSRRWWQEVRRTRLGVVFQAGELLGDLTPVENVLVPALLAGVPREQAQERARALLSEVGVPLDVERTALLSGGERQRVALARALVADPELVLADEPTAALDRDNRGRIRELLLHLAHERGRAVLVATHDPELADAADRVLALGAS